LNRNRAIVYSSRNTFLFLQKPNVANRIQPIYSSWAILCNFKLAILLKRKLKAKRERNIPLRDIIKKRIRKQRNERGKSMRLVEILTTKEHSICSRKDVGMALHFVIQER
jgi:hypothetical protein